MMLLCLQGWAKPETIDERKDACRPFLYSYNLELVRPYLMYELLVTLGLSREGVCGVVSHLASVMVLIGTALCTLSLSTTFGGGKW